MDIKKLNLFREQNLFKEYNSGEMIGILHNCGIPKYATMLKNLVDNNLLVKRGRGKYGFTKDPIYQVKLENVVNNVRNSSYKSVKKSLKKSTPKPIKSPIKSDSSTYDLLLKEIEVSKNLSEQLKASKKRIEELTSKL